METAVYTVPVTDPRLATTRKHAGLTQQALADTIGALRLGSCGLGGMEIPIQARRGESIGRSVCMSDQSVSKSSGRKRRKVLAPSQKYELWVSLLTGQATQREAAEKYGVDRSTVIGVCRTAKDGALAALSRGPGRPGQTPEQAELAAARAEIERLKATVTEQAVALHLHEGKARWD